jgi:hypothetical protein
MKPDWSTTIPGIYGLLSVFRTKLLKNSTTTTWPYEERSSLALGMTPTQHLRRTKDKNVLQPSANSAGLWKEVLSSNRRISLWRGRRTLATGKNPPYTRRNLKPKHHPIAYYSATFTPTERNYDIYERELLAIMKALGHWRPYLGWTKEPFTILTDHTNLQYWKAP